MPQNAEDAKKIRITTYGFSSLEKQTCKYDDLDSNPSKLMIDNNWFDEELENPDSPIVY